MNTLTDLNQALPVPEGGIASRPLLDLKESTKLVLFALDQGQEISPHTAPFPAELIALEGELEVLVGEHRFAIQPHQAIELPSGHPHGVLARTPARFLLIMRRGAPKAALAAQARSAGAQAESTEDACASHGCDHAASVAGIEVRHPVLRKWMVEHDEALKVLDRMEVSLRQGEWAGVKEGATWLYHELKAHNEAEEEHLFPLMDPFFGGGHGPTQCMRDEHRLLWDLTLAVLGDITDGKARNPQSSERICQQLISTLRSHVDKENKVLYPMAERILDAAALDRLGRVMV
ncbi:MAG TPA: hemerythrin domain-containing protein [Holophagaceae bacterium]|nr:hemerythrin domain-containing protein [Holophagaceae bacterium]